MPEAIVRTGADRDYVLELIRHYKIPFTVTIKKGTHRSLEQNRLQFMWLNEAADQLKEYTAEEYRAFCKLHFGVPILRGEDEEFREVYDRVVKPLSYEHKLAAMIAPLDLPVTSRMTTGQKKRYLDDMYAHFATLGVQLTEPEHG